MKTVAVIGAGTAGLTTIKELQQAGLEPTAFERLSSPGGRWAGDATRGIWKELCLNLTRRWMEFSDFPWDESLYQKEKAYGGLFPHYEEYKEYVNAYAKHFDLLKYVRFETEVVNIEQSKDGRWTIFTTPAAGGKTTEQKFDGLVICSGIYCKQYNPLAETTLKEFSGKVIHSEHFQSSLDYKGKRVLVIGSVISGPEIAAVLATEGECQTVCNSTRHVTYHMSKISPQNKKPFDDLMFVRFPAWLGRILPESMMLPGLKSLVLENFDQLEQGPHCYATPNPDISVAGIGTTKNYVEQVRAGNLSVVPGIDSAKGKTVTFTDGSSQDFDVIICGTGYGPDVSILPTELKEKYLYTAAGGKQELELYHDCLVPDMDNLAFCGIMTVVGPLPPTMEMQARFIAGTFSGRVKRPGLANMKKTAKAEREARETSSFKQYKNCVVLMEEIGDDLGVTPSLFKAFRSPSKYLFGPNYPVQYRTNPALDGKEVAAKAEERFEYYLSHPQTAEL